MGKRLYEVQFESWGTSPNGGGWMSNWSKRTVAITGGAEAAIKEALRREKGGQIRLRVEQVILRGAED
jgi:hypothetical protein